jgi:hypothetical protein
MCYGLFLEILELQICNFIAQQTITYSGVSSVLKFAILLLDKQVLSSCFVSFKFAISLLDKQVLGSCFLAFQMCTSIAKTLPQM